MNTLHKALLIYLSILNTAAFILCAIDKNRAKREKWRIPEAFLLCISLLGGSVGMLTGMYVFNHKIRKSNFFLGVPIIIAIQIVSAAYLYYRGVL